MISATRSDSTRPSPVSTLRSLTRAAPSSVTVFRDRRQIAKSWSTLGSTRDAAVSRVSRRTTRPPSSNGSRLYSSSPATSMPTVPIAMARRQREAADDRERGIFQQQTRAQLPVEPRDRRHRASPRRRPSACCPQTTPAFIRSAPPVRTCRCIGPCSSSRRMEVSASDHPVSSRGGEHSVRFR